jgi:hypothetical protein
LEKLQLSKHEKDLLRASEDHVLDYFLQQDAVEYAHLLLKVLDEVVVPSSKNSRVSKLSLEEVLADDEALQLLYVDYIGVIAHYAISKLCDVIFCLKESPNNKSKVTLSSTFYPDGILIENWRPLLRVLVGGGSDAFAQRESLDEWMAFSLGYMILKRVYCITSQPFCVLPYSVFRRSCVLSRVYTAGR